MVIRRLLEVLLDPRQIPAIMGWRAAYVRREGFQRLRRLRKEGIYYFCRLPSLELDSIAPPLPKPVDVIMDHICLPPYRKPGTHDDVTPLLRILHHLKPEVVLEFGTAHGNTVANICNACGACVVTVNALPDQMNGQFPTFALTKDQIGPFTADTDSRSR